MNEIFKGMDNAAEQINENFEGIADYVVEQGENSNGSYTKWASGRLECWTLIPYRQNVDMDWVSSGGYSRSETFDWVFPVEFVDIPVLTNSSSDFTGSDFVGARVRDNIRATYRYMSFFKKTKMDAFALGMRADGRWK